MFSNLIKAAVSVAVSPVAFVVDVVTLPASAFDNKDDFHRTGALLSNASKCIEEATKPSKD